MMTDKARAQKLRRQRKRGKRLAIADHRWLLEHDRAIKLSKKRRKVRAIARKARSPNARPSTALTDAKAVTLALGLWTVNGRKRKPRKPRQRRGIAQAMAMRGSGLIETYNARQARYRDELAAWERWCEVRANLTARWERRPKGDDQGLARATTTFEPYTPPIDVDFPEGFEPDESDSEREPISMTLTYPILPPASGRAISATIRYDMGRNKGFWVNAIALERDWPAAAIAYVRAIEKYVTRYENDSISGISTFVV